MSKLWQAWKKLVLKIGDAQASLIFSILYFLLITPVGIVASIFNDFLKVRSASSWQKVEDNAGNLGKLKEQS